MKVGIVFSLGTSLEDWEESGMLSREIRLYNELAVSVDSVTIFTYGGEADLDYADQFVENVRIVPKQWVDNDILYSLLLPVIHAKAFRDVDIVRTTQFAGSWAAVAAKHLHRNSFIHRSGYIWSLFDDRSNASKYWIKRLAERLTCRVADAILTSSPHGYDYIESKYNPDCEHHVVPNYVEIEKFRPVESPPDPGTICFVGRLSPQKNLEALIEAVAETPYSLTLVGDGPLRPDLKALAQRLEADVTFEGNVPNEDVVNIVNQHAVFVLPSHHEGMPKSLLEAMACGRAVVASDVIGNNDVITDGENGILCGTDADSIRDALNDVFADNAQRERLGRNARKTIVEEYSLEEVINLEQDVLRSVEKA